MGWTTENLVVKPNTALWRELRVLDDVCFPDDTPYPFEGGKIIAAISDERDRFIAYGVLDKSDTLIRIGVVQEWRGNGLQRTLTKRILREAKKMGVKRVKTYTALTPEGCLSAVNMMLCGFEITKKSGRWLYLAKEL